MNRRVRLTVRLGGTQSSRQMPHIRREAYPSMHALFVDRANRKRKIRVGESAYWNPDDIRMIVHYIMNGRATDRAEMKRYLAAGIADADKRC